MPTRPPALISLAPARNPAVLCNRFRLDAELGKGATGTVYKAYDTLLQRWVAIKMLSMSNPLLIRRFSREAVTGAQLQGEHCVDIFDALQDPHKGPFIVMELLQGNTLESYLREMKARWNGRGDLTPLSLVIAIGLQICEALREAHELRPKRIIHRDIKPSNIFLVERKSGSLVKVLDFGIALLVSGAGQPGAAAKLTTTGAPVGTPGYMALEQWINEGIGPKVDIHGLGCVLYEMVRGESPFSSSNNEAIIHRQADCPHPSPKSSSSGFDRLIMRMIENEPSDRPNLDEVIEGLVAALEEGGAGAFPETGRGTGRVLKIDSDAVTLAGDVPAARRRPLLGMRQPTVTGEALLQYYLDANGLREEEHFREAAIIRLTKARMDPEAIEALGNRDLQRLIYHSETVIENLVGDLKDNRLLPREKIGLALAYAKLQQVYQDGPFNLASVVEHYILPADATSGVVFDCYRQLRNDIKDAALLAGVEPDAENQEVVLGFAKEADLLLQSAGTHAAIPKLTLSLLLRLALLERRIYGCRASFRAYKDADEHRNSLHRLSLLRRWTEKEDVAEKRQALMEKLEKSSFSLGDRLRTLGLK